MKKFHEHVDTARKYRSDVPARQESDQAPGFNIAMEMLRRKKSGDVAPESSAPQVKVTVQPPMIY